MYVTPMTRQLAPSEADEVKLELLNEAVDVLARKKSKTVTTAKSSGQPGSDMKIPWGEVAKYIVDQGASYEFANSTCRKKWEEINEDKENSSDSDVLS